MNGTTRPAVPLQRRGIGRPTSPRGTPRGPPSEPRDLACRAMGWKPPGGEIGKRRGLKIPTPQGGAGSSPAPGTRRCRRRRIGGFEALDELAQALEPDELVLEAGVAGVEAARVGDHEDVGAIGGWDALGLLPCPAA